jgi:hypothetical protein
VVFSGRKDFNFNIKGEFMSIVYKRLDWDWKWVLLGAFIAFVVILCSSWVDHTADYHVNNPIDQENHDREQAERDSSDNNVSTYEDHNGNTHTLYDGGEVT